MSDYKTTLNLPSTEFPMRASLPIREPETLKNWQQEDLYHAMRDARKGAAKFILHDGPPYANGHLHCGHALNKILKDIIVKSKHLSGYDANFVPGWDCHGLPIELNVEKKIGRAGDKVTAKEFREVCAKYAKDQMSIQAEEAKRLGVVGDFENPYATMRYDYEASVVRALGKILEQGHLQQGFKPVHWCVACASALAEAEVEYEDKTSPAIDVAFELVDFKSLNLDLGSVKHVMMPIWTTTPWTLPANEAVAVHPTHKYALVQHGENAYIVAEELVEGFVKRAQFNEYKALHTLLGSAFEHQMLFHPWLDKKVPVILGEHVTMDTGTGCVHTAPSHGPEDYVIGCQYGLPIENLLKPNGCFIDNLEHIAGISVWKANPIIIELLEKQGKLIAHEPLFHSYPHCWRHKTPLIFMATPQWFVMMDTAGLRQKLLAEIEKVEWLPEWGQNRMRLMIETRPDWCLSRQRSWGTPMTLFVHKETKKLHPKSLEFIEIVAQKIEKTGLEAWFSLDAKDLLGDDVDQYEKVTDTLDVWFDSGVSHYAVLGQETYELKFPANLYLEGSDQYRGWFNSSLTTAVAMGLPAPYRSVLIHGFTVDGEGKKLSKSKGNYVELNTLINQHGADVLRLWVSSTDYRYEVGISPEILQRTSDAYRRIRNTARFLLSNLFDYDHASDAVTAEEMVEIDAYILEKTQLLQQEIVKAYDAYQFHVVYQKILHFCAIDLGSFYLDIIKDRQYTLPKGSMARRSCQTAMYHIIQALTLWLAPILSFTAEEIWKYIPGHQDESVFLAKWYDAFPPLKIVDFAVWEKLQALRDEVNKALEMKRQQGIIGSGLAASVTLYVHSTDLEWLKPYADELKFFFITSAGQIEDINDADESSTYLAEDLNMRIAVNSIESTKCERCWHRHPSVGVDSSYTDLCHRCIDNISGRDEVRARV
jgi:isoleucyl-tRNA synthetase